MKIDPSMLSPSMRRLNADLFPAPQQACPDATNDELALHDEIIAFCRERRWPYIRARSDMPSGIAVGANDFTIFADHSRVLLVECKSEKGKLSNGQRGWRLAMHIMGHEVHVIQSMREFIELTQTTTNPL